MNCFKTHANVNKKNEPCHKIRAHGGIEIYFLWMHFDHRLDLLQRSILKSDII